jgi:hypothetical protein
MTEQTQDRSRATTQKRHEAQLTTRSRRVHHAIRLYRQKRTERNASQRTDKNMTITKTVSTLIGLTMTLAVAGVSFAAQTTPAPAAKAAVAATGSKSAKKSTAKKHGKATSKAKSTKTVAAATPAK